MKILSRAILPILAGAVWVSVSEFARNQFLLNDLWINHYITLGLVFPSEIINGLIWGLWSLCFASLVYIISRKFSLWETTFISWFAAFFLMWLVIGNMNVLPYEILIFSIPWSIAETYITAIISTKVS